MYVFHHTYLLEDCSLCLLYHLDCCFVVGFQPHVRLIIGLTVWLRLWNLSHIFRLMSLIISFTWSHKHYTYCGELNDSGFTMYFWLMAFVMKKIYFFYNVVHKNEKRCYIYCWDFYYYQSYWLCYYFVLTFI